MTKVLDLTDIQGNVVRAFGRFGFPVARYLFFRIHDGAKGRKFVGAVTEKVTTSETWEEGPHPIKKPLVTVNLAFTYPGLCALELPRESLAEFPSDFAMGMKKRKDILGDDGPSAPQHWDPIWRNEVHIFVSLNGQGSEYIEESYQWLLDLLEQSEGGVSLLTGHRGDNGVDNLPFQDAQIIFENGQPTAREHFGYTDGIGDPVFEGLPRDANCVIGRGKQMDNGGWEPLATGEFLLGHFDEANEYPPAPRPILLSRNGTYMVYRKLHENVGTFNAYLEQQGKIFPGGKELLAAKFVGRWRDNGAPLVSAPDAESKKAWDAKFAQANPEERDRMLSDITYDDDVSGAKCPLSAHIRRINPRASLDFGNRGGVRYAWRADQPPPIIAPRPALWRGQGPDPGRRQSRHHHHDVECGYQSPVRICAAAMDQLWQRFQGGQRQGNRARQP